VEQAQFPVRQQQQGGNGQNFNRNEPSLRDIIRDQVRIKDEVGKKIHATDKLLENVNAKIDSFIVATYNQPSFNKILETQIQQISTAIPCRVEAKCVRQTTFPLFSLLSLLLSSSLS
jgi:hypothetical protein